ncbi:MAG TPA: hypothetical protein H9879_04415 [Candidatus Alistipes intestinipullorum]|nr:hypothetical protein [Candidatus Alistipes intestinipullorum]
MGKIKVHVVCQTHWDREHRSNFQETRLLLVEMMDRLMSMFDSDPDFHTFIIDGQTVVLEDYLAIKPYNRARIEALVRDGRLQIGPWYTLPDHTPSNPESLIRNLLLGKQLSLEFGKRMDVGYSIFSFGQIGQLPQIYRNFGIDELIFYKGAPLNELKHNEFFWESPDGTRALASRLGDWFRCNFFVYFTVPVILGGDMNKVGGWKCMFRDKRRLTLGCDPLFGWQPAVELEPDIRIRREEIPRAIEDVLHTVRNSHSRNVKIAMEGIDFSCPVPELTAAMKLANEVCPDKVELVQSDLRAYFDDFKKDVDLSSLEVLRGEMRYGPIGKIHSETLSSATQLKQLTAQAENLLLHYIEPYATFMRPYGYAYPKEILMEAWRDIMKVEAHDSIHGAGTKEILPNSLHLIHQAIDIAQAVARRGFENVIRQLDTSEFDADTVLLTVFNPLPYVYDGVVRVKISLPREDYAKLLTVRDLDGNLVDSYIHDRTDAVLGAVNPENRPKSIFVRTFTVDLYVKGVPAMGYKTLTVERSKNPDSEENPFGEPYFPYKPIVRGDGSLDNGRLRVSVNADCTLRIEDLETGQVLERTHILRDSGDAGNVWVHVAPSFNRTCIPLASSAELRIGENSFLRGSVDICYSLQLPTGVEKDKKRRNADSRRVDIVTTVSLDRDSRTVRFRTSVNNCVEDHKLSVLFPTGIAASKSYSDGAFEVVERPIDVTTNHNGRTGDEILRHPMQKFLDISDGARGVALMSKGIHEFSTDLIDGKSVVELTLLRSVTQTFPIHGDVFVTFDENPAQSQGEQVFEYALNFHAGDYMAGNVMKTAFCYVVPPAVYQHAPGTKRGMLPLVHSFLEKTNDVVTLHAVKKEECGDDMILRLCNPSSQAQRETVSLTPRCIRAWKCYADEREIAEIDVKDGVVELEIAPYKIVTLKIRTAPLEGTSPAQA